MTVIDVGPEQHAEVEAIHSDMGMDYKCPDLTSPLLIVKKAVTNDKGEVIGACLLRLTAETILLLSPELDPKQKMDAMEEMQPEVLQAAWQLGLDDVEARIPTDTEHIFEKRLNQLGWSRDRDGWHPWSRSTEGSYGTDSSK
jgi:hypothetical protein